MWLRLLAWSPLAGGILTGKYARGTKPAAGTRAGSNDPVYEWATGAYLDCDQSWTTIDTLNRTAEHSDGSTAQVAVAWLLAQPGITAAIIGARNTDQLADTLAATDLQLTTQQLQDLTEVSAPHPNAYPYSIFGTAQQARHLNGGTVLEDIVSTGNSGPLGS